MAALRSFEIEAIRLLAQNFLSEPQLQAVFSAQKLESYEYTGSGYFLSVRASSLPQGRMTLSEPAVVGNSGNIQAGLGG